MKNIMESICTWFEKAKPNPTEKDLAVQVGCHFEEVVEMLESTGDSESTLGTLEDLAGFYKSGCGNVTRFDRLALLDALCDQIVTAIGIGYMAGFDMQAALAEVDRSNWSKFENGHPVFNAQGKIAKGRNYTPPDLKPALVRAPQKSTY